MIKTATSSIPQDSDKSAEFTGESSGNTKQAAGPSRETSAEGKGTQVTSREERALTKQLSPDTGEVQSAKSIHEDLREIDQKLKAWQERVNELLSDPNNADKIANLLNSIQYMINRRAELSILLRQFVPSSNGYDFQDNQSILRAGSVRRKDKDALIIIERKPVIY